MLSRRLGNPGQEWQAKRRFDLLDRPDALVERFRDERETHAEDEPAEEPEEGVAARLGLDLGGALRLADQVRIRGLQVHVQLQLLLAGEQARVLAAGSAAELAQFAETMLDLGQGGLHRRRVELAAVHGELAPVGGGELRCERRVAVLDVEVEQVRARVRGDVRGCQESAG